MDILQKMFSCGGSRRYIFSDEMSGVFPSNTTCAVYNNNLVVNVRGLDYYYPTDFGKLVGPVISSNWIGYMDDVSLKAHQQPIELGQLAYHGLFKGREDIRLVNWGDKLYGICSRPDAAYDRIVMELLEFDNQLNPNHLGFNAGLQSVEKNWMPIDDRPMRFIYNISQGVVVDWTPDGCVFSEPNAIAPASGSGGTNLISYNGHHIGIVHRHELLDGCLIYYHSFVIYNDDMTKVRQTEWFKFSTYPIEFVSGMCIYDNSLIITLSEMDSIPIMLTFSVSALDLLIREGGANIQPGFWSNARWIPDYIGDPYQNISYQLFLGNRHNYINTLKVLNLYTTESINKLHYYGIIK